MFVQFSAPNERTFIFHQDRSERLRTTHSHNKNSISKYPIKSEIPYDRLARSAHSHLSFHFINIKILFLYPNTILHFTIQFIRKFNDERDNLIFVTLQNSCNENGK